MSLRALKKRENQQLSAKQLYNNNNLSGTSKKSTLYKKLNNNNLLAQQQQQKRKYILSDTASNNSSRIDIKKQRALLGRYTQSNPELHKIEACFQNYNSEHLLRTKSDNDISLHMLNSAGTCSAPTPTKSEVCLKTISTHNYQQQVKDNTTTTTTSTATKNQTSSRNMLSGARSHRDLTLSADDTNSDITPRRMSESNSLSMRSQSLTSATSTSTITTNSSNIMEINSNAVIRVPIIGYEVMEERARFTVYKLRVEKPLTNDCWLVLRRYTDFVRLNSKLKEAFPHINLMLPRKKIFGDNFNDVFLDNRVQGLQMFVNSIMAREDLRKSVYVREFFCLDEPPACSESMEECRAIFEAQEETIAHLKLLVNNKNDLILSLQQKLREEIMEKNQLKEVLKNLSKSSFNSSSSSTASN